MILCRTRRELRSRLRQFREEGSATALVPTMGHLHEGHLALVDRARELADRVVVSVFVNPLQFGPEEDLERYPRDLDRDRGLLTHRGADLCFAPSVGEMYPDGEPRVAVDPGPMARSLCGRHRPGHFRGVLTVVARLFGLVRPQVAVFGRKDFQQAVLIRTMARDLEMGVQVETAPVVREADGLALSSRNILLGEDERKEAPALYAGLEEALRAFQGGERDGSVLLSRIRSSLEGKSCIRVQYAELVDPETLEPLSSAVPGAVLALAAFVGETRLIDNLELL